MNHEYDQSRASDSAPATSERDSAPGQSSRSALMRKPDRAVASGLVQRKESGGGGGEDHAASLVARAGDGAGGSALPAHLKEKFEASTGADLSAVRIHTGQASSQAAQGISALAYTLGNDIHFAEGQYRPDSREGEQLLAHEVAHTVQQSGGVGRKVQPKLEMSEPGDSHEVEADRAAANMVDGLLAQISGASGVSRKIMRTGTNGQGGDIEVLVDGAHHMPDLIQPRYSTGGRNFALTYRGDFELYRALTFNLTGANTGQIGTPLHTIWGSETLMPGHITSHGATNLVVNMTFFVQNNRSDSLGFQVHENGVKTAPVVSSGPTQQRDLDPESHLTSRASGPVAPTLSISVADGVSLTETATNTFTRTSTTTQTGGVSGEVASGDAKEGLAGKLGASYSFAVAEAGALAQSLASASGVSVTTTRTMTASVSGPLQARPYVFRVVPTVSLKSLKTVIFDAHSDGVIPTGNPVKTIFTHSKKIVGTNVYQGRDDADVARKVAADDLSPAYPDAPAPGAATGNATGAPGATTVAGAGNAPNPALPPAGHAGSDPDNPAAGNPPPPGGGGAAQP